VDASVTVGGIRIPSSDPFFLGVLAVHVAAGIVSVIAGATAAFAAKRRGRHTTAGLIYFRALTVVFVTMSILAAMRWKENYHLFVIGLVSFCSAVLARRAILERGSRRTQLHLVGMGASYTLLLVAFYVDLGHQLPLWKRLPPVWYWLLPGAVGAGLTVRALLRHPLARAERAREPA
jgi:hypothetical protein